MSRVPSISYHPFQEGNLCGAKSGENMVPEDKAVVLDTARGQGVTQGLLVQEARNAQFMPGQGGYALLTEVASEVPVRLDMVDADNQQTVCVEFVVRADAKRVESVKAGCW